MPPFIYINGYPGVGKFTVAKEVCKLLPNAKVINNHLLINPAAAVFDRTDEEYQPLRKALRSALLHSIATAKSTHDVAWIFTDQQSSSILGSSVAREYQNAALVRESPFFSIILHCEVEENLKRAVSGNRGSTGSNTKLTDINILRGIREREDIFHFGDANELELDVTELSPIEAAIKIHEHFGKAL
ncbi:hypothetical protein QBC38DRAFT_464820 [Podospora fimiseda]|uniref:Uncharacterized protein n=1 Tax=Podospora fimiseda TaxID=252190 RepID=A0AAN7BYA2_9PEZI|nr:hypothetical protein QBC38DRAFT_464820 [Podospora fimiseda]